MVNICPERDEGLYDRPFSLQIGMLQGSQIKVVRGIYLITEFEEFVNH